MAWAMGGKSGTALPLEGEQDLATDGDDDEDGPPRLPGGKFHMTPERHARLRAELGNRRAERHRVVKVVS